MKKIIIAGAVLIVVLIVLLLLPTQQPVEQPIVDPLDTSTWQTFQSSQFGFTVQHPSTWVVREFYNDPIAPRVNIFKAGETRQPPFDHHSQVSQVSFFPQGVPTEGVFGKFVTSTIVFNEPHERAYDFVLEDGTPWGTILTPLNPPAAWQPGFIWIEAEIKNLEERCFRDGEVVEMNACDLLGGSDRLVRTGTVNAQDREIAEEILKTFRFNKL